MKSATPIATSVQAPEKITTSVQAPDEQVFVYFFMFFKGNKN